MDLVKIDYLQLNARQKELFNFQKLSGVLADYGITTILLSDDWEGADFLAKSVLTGKVTMVQLKPRFGLWQKYEGKHLWIAFPHSGDWYMYDHDEMLSRLQLSKHKLFSTDSWLSGKAYTFPKLPLEIKPLLVRL